MHVNADWAILEVVDEDNRPVPDGTKGAKVLITNLANFVQPIIRYEIGDIVTMATEPCGCGSNLPLIAGIDGRDSDMFWIEGDEGDQPLPPAIFEVALGQIAQIREYQIDPGRPQSISHLARTVARQRTWIASAPRRLIQEQLEEYDLGQRLQIEIEVVERLAPEDGNKFKRVVSKVKRPEADCSRSRRRLTATARRPHVR